MSLERKNLRKIWRSDVEGVAETWNGGGWVSLQQYNYEQTTESGIAPPLRATVRYRIMHLGF